MKKLIIIFLLFAGLAVPAAAQVWETSAESSRSEHRLQMTGGTGQWTLNPLSTQSLHSSRSYRSSVGSSAGGFAAGGGLVSVGAGAPSAALSGGALPQVQFGRGTVGNGELVSDPTAQVSIRYIGGGNSGGGDGPTNLDDVWKTPIGDMPWWLLLFFASFIVVFRANKTYKWL